MQTLELWLIGRAAHKINMLIDSYRICWLWYWWLILDLEILDPFVSGSLLDPGIKNWPWSESDALLTLLLRMYSTQLGGHGSVKHSVDLEAFKLVMSDFFELPLEGVDGWSGFHSFLNQSIRSIMYINLILKLIDV